ncbi:MAG: transglycosylase domain-containing protein [Solirubrobacterales bacterium]
MDPSDTDKPTRSGTGSLPGNGREADASNGSPTTNGKGSEAARGRNGNGDHGNGSNENRDSGTSEVSVLRRPKDDRLHKVERVGQVSGFDDPSSPKGPRIKMLRVLFVLFGLGILALASVLFGMVMAVSQDLPAIEKYTQFSEGENSVLTDSQGEVISTISSNENRFLLEPDQISPNMKNAVVSIEDARFYEHRGVDYQGLARALVQDVLSLSFKQGASTITQQLVKQALEAQAQRTVFQKMREISLSYHIERTWTKDKILTEYLNSVYFGSGAYGIEAAARTYFGAAHPECGTDEDPCAALLNPAESAMLAGIIQNPYGYDPKFNPKASLARRNLVLDRMFEQGFITEAQYSEARAEPLPAPSTVEPPQIDSEAPYFTSWIRQQLVDRFGAGRTFFGGLTVKSSLDLEMQRAAEDAVYSTIGGIGPDAAVVVINNEDATIDAMVAGEDFDTKPFNLATQGYRQVGSTVKAFVLAAALEQGVSPYSVYESAPQLFTFGKKGKEYFPVKNYEDSYLGSASLATATTYSDNSVYAQVGLESIKGGTRHIARVMHKMGVSDRIDLNPAMVLGTTEVTPLQWTYAFSTLANEGERVSGTLAPEPGDSPVSYTKVTDGEGKTIRGGDNEVIETEALSPAAAQTAKSMLASVISSGTGTNASVGDDSQWGKTGTTENNSNAWFCGAITEVTACVWVGYSEGYQEMTTEYGGSPVDGGTFPAIIWSRVIEAWKSIEAGRAYERETSGDDSESDSSSYDYGGYSGGTDYAPAPSTSAPAPSAPAPATPAPAPAAPAPAAPATSGGASSSGGFTP